MKYRKGFHLSINVVVGLIIGGILIVVLITMASDVLNEGKDQIFDLAGFIVPYVSVLLTDISNTEAKKSTGRSKE